VVFPAVGKYVDAKNKAVADAQAAARAAQDAAAEARRLAADKAKAEAAAAAEAAEVARRVEVHFGDTWTGVSEFRKDLYPCKSEKHQPMLFRISVEGRKLSASTLTGNACVSAKTVLWTGELPRETIIVGDLPLTLEVKVFTSPKSSPVVETMTVNSVGNIWIDGVNLFFAPGDQRKQLAKGVAELDARGPARPNRVGPGNWFYNQGEADRVMQRNRADDNRQRQITDYTRTGDCNGCNGMYPSESH
jgi:hypothetical protein